VFRPDASDPSLDALTAPACWARWAARHGGLAPEAVKELVADFGLGPHLDKELFRLSTGTRRKVGLLAAFASAATITLIDEPFAALDKASIAVVTDGLEAVAGHPRRAWVVATHTPLDLGGPVLTLGQPFSAPAGPCHARSAPS
jgi:ABC-type multidrug transport system ATPase subunit